MMFPRTNVSITTILCFVSDIKYFIRTRHLPVDDIGVVEPRKGIISIDIFYLVFYCAESVGHDGQAV